MCVCVCVSVYVCMCARTRYLLLWVMVQVWKTFTVIMLCPFPPPLPPPSTGLLYCLIRHCKTPDTEMITVFSRSKCNAGWAGLGLAHLNSLRRFLSTGLSPVIWYLTLGDQGKGIEPRAVREPDGGWWFRIRGSGLVSLLMKSVVLDG